LTAHISKVYDLFVASPDNPTPCWLRTFTSEDDVANFVANYLSKDKREGYEIEVKTMWRKYYETV